MHRLVTCLLHSETRRGRRTFPLVICQPLTQVCLIGLHGRCMCCGSVVSRLSLFFARIPFLGRGSILPFGPRKLALHQTAGPMHASSATEGTAHYGVYWFRLDLPEFRGRAYFMDRCLRTTLSYRSYRRGSGGFPPSSLRFCPLALAKRSLDTKMRGVLSYAMVFYGDLFHVIDWYIYNTSVTVRFPRSRVNSFLRPTERAYVLIAHTHLFLL